MRHIKTIEGQMEAKGLKIALVAARFNNFVVERLLEGALDYLLRHGAERENLTVIRGPGAFELPLICRKIALSGSFDGLVALGAVIRGGTPHFDYVCAETVKGLAQVSLDSGLPVGFGVLTTDNLEQAVERAGGKSGNKGVEAASAMLETLRVLQQI
jgi:6,7-dimethyl-8-ribityllumazine synthase